MALSFLVMGPVCGGVIAGVLHTILGPDHLCTIVTLSACQGSEAFWFGVQWAGGHLSGMVLIGTVVALLNSQVSGETIEAYEHYADYAVGFMLIAFGSYFIVNADKYFDAEWSPKQASCACHAKEASSGHDGGNHVPSYGGIPEPIKGHHAFAMDARQTGSTLVGFVQGVACPAGIVGMVFLKQYTPMEMCIFLPMFFTVTTLAMGLLAMAYGMLTKNCISSAVLGRGIYYASCTLSVTLGIAWLALNYTHRLDALLGHDHDHHHHGHSHHDHVHSHAIPEGSFLFLLAN